MAPPRNAPPSTHRQARKRLSTSEITAAALRIADVDGVEALSMRRLAAELGVGTMTLYGYFRSKEELLDAIVDRAADELRLPPPESPWREGIERIAREIRRVLERHPAGIRMRMTRPMLSPGALRSAERAYEILDRAGFEPALAARCYRTVFLYAFGFASFTQPPSPAAAGEQALLAALALPPDEYPYLRAAAPHAAAAMAGDEQFEFGLGLILEGIEASHRDRTAELGSADR